MDIHAKITSSNFSNPFGGRGFSSGHPAGRHIHSASTISEILGGNIVNAIDGIKASSGFARELCDNPAVTPFWNVIFNQPESVNVLSLTVSSSKPFDHLIFSPVNFIEAFSRAASTQPSGAKGDNPVYSNPFFQEKYQCPDFA